MDIATRVAEFLQDRGASLVGFADLAPLPASVRHDLPRAVAFGVALAPEIIAAIHDGPTKEYYAEYNRANRLLSELSAMAADFLVRRGHRAARSAATNEGIDPATHSTLLPHKTVATRAGLGWIGKCALLITEDFGSAVRLNRVLTDAPLPTAAPIVDSHCGDCRACVDACPGQAPAGRNWQPAMHREEIYDAFACRQTARDLAQQKTGISGTFCGICITACPWTQKYIRRSIEPK